MRTTFEGTTEVYENNLDMEGAPDFLLPEGANFAFDTGGGDDVLAVSFDGGGGFSSLDFDGGGGDDELSVDLVDSALWWSRTRR